MATMRPTKALALLLAIGAPPPFGVSGQNFATLMAFVPENCADLITVVSTCFANVACITGCDLPTYQPPEGDPCDVGGCVLSHFTTCCSACVDQFDEIAACSEAELACDLSCDADAGANATDPGANGTEPVNGNGFPPNFLADIPECGVEYAAVGDCLAANLPACGSCLVGLERTQLDACGGAGELVCAVQGCCEGCANETAELLGCVSANVLDTTNLFQPDKTCEIECGNETTPTETTTAATSPAGTDNTTTTALPAQTNGTLPEGPDVTLPTLPDDLSPCRDKWTALTGCITENSGACASCLTNLMGVTDGDCGTLQKIVCECCSQCSAQTREFGDCLIENRADLPDGERCDLTCPGDTSEGCTLGATAAVSTVGAGLAGAGLAWIIA